MIIEQAKKYLNSHISNDPEFYLGRMVDILGSITNIISLGSTYGHFEFLLFKKLNRRVKLLCVDDTTFFTELPEELKEVSFRPICDELNKSFDKFAGDNFMIINLERANDVANTISKMNPIGFCVMYDSSIESEKTFIKMLESSEVKIGTSSYKLSFSDSINDSFCRSKIVIFTKFY